MSGLPEMTQVVSSNVGSIGYKRETMELYVEFQDGSLYKYLNVPEIIYQNLMSAESKGSYLAQNVKYGKYDYLKL